MKKYKIEFVIRVPEGISDGDVMKWVQYMVGDTGRLSAENPLYDTSFDPVLGTIKIEGVE